MKKNLIILTICILYFVGCASNNTVKDINYESLFEKGQIALQKKKYLKAQELFNSIVIGASHTDLGDDALFYLGESYYLNKEYILATAEYDKLIRRMPFSEYVERARYRTCQAYLAESPKYYRDQTYTTKALEKFQEFLDDYPGSDHRKEAEQTIMDMRNKLAQKAYETGILYIKLEEYRSAKIAFSIVTESYYDTKFNGLAHANIIRCILELGQAKDARDYYQKNRRFIEKSGQSENVELWLKEGHYKEIIKID